MLEKIAIIILFGSIFGIGIILLRKIPALIKLPVSYNSTDNAGLFGSVKNISLKNILRDILFGIKNLILKTKNNIFSLTEKSEEKERKRKKIESDTYWQELKKSTKRKK